MGYVYIVIVLGLCFFWLLSIIFALITKGLQSIVAGYVTPSSHRPMGKYKESEGYESLRKEGYDVTVDWACNAMSKVERK